MRTKLLVFAALPLALAGAAAAQQASTQASAAQQPAAAQAQPVMPPPPGVVPPPAEPDPAALEKLHALKAQLHEEFTKKRASTPEEAQAFRDKAVQLNIEVNNLTGKRPIPLMDDARFSVHQLIYTRPRIAARIFSYELEIYKSTEAYDYRAQAESVYGDRAAAEADYGEALKISPQPEIYAHRGHLYLGQRKYDLAIADFSQAIKTGAPAPAYYDRAMAYLGVDNYADAADDLAQFFKANTDKDFAAMAGRSRLCRGLRRHGFAVEGCAAEDKRRGPEVKR